MIHQFEKEVKYFLKFFIFFEYFFLKIQMEESTYNLFYTDSLLNLRELIKSNNQFLIGCQISYIFTAIL